MKTSELTGPALDWAVAKCEGLDVFIPAYADKAWLQIRCDGNEFRCPNWSVNWTHGGPIIEREKIHLRAPAQGQDLDYAERLQYLEKEQWFARISAEHTTYLSFGPTPLIAAMRCYVASKLGDEMDVPEWLT